jgi:hypothetical protein
VKTYWILWWVAGSTVDSSWIYSIVVSCLDTSTSLVSVFFEQRIWQPILSTNNRLIPDIQAHFHIGEGTLRMHWLSYVFASMCRYDMQMDALGKISLTQESKLQLSYCDDRPKHSWLHFEHCHVGKSSMVPMQPVKRFVCYPICLLLTSAILENDMFNSINCFTGYPFQHVSFSVRDVFLTKINIGKWPCCKLSFAWSWAGVHIQQTFFSWSVCQLRESILWKYTKIMTKVRKSAMVGDIQVLAAGDMCAICQEKMHAPISLRCKHVFCEDCVSEWYAIWLGSFNPFFM